MRVTMTRLWETGKKKAQESWEIQRAQARRRHRKSPRPWWGWSSAWSRVWITAAIADLMLGIFLK